MNKNDNLDERTKIIHLKSSDLALKVMSGLLFLSTITGVGFSEFGIMVIIFVTGFTKIIYIRQKNAVIEKLNLFFLVIIFVIAFFLIYLFSEK